MRLRGPGGERVLTGVSQTWVTLRDVIEAVRVPPRSPGPFGSPGGSGQPRATRRVGSARLTGPRRRRRLPDRDTPAAVGHGARVTVTPAGACSPDRLATSTALADGPASARAARSRREEMPSPQAYAAAATATRTTGSVGLAAPARISAGWK